MSLTPPLLAAMSGAKPRARRERIPVSPESRLHTDVADLLRDHCLPGWNWTHINRKCKDAREGAIMKRMGVNRGWPDFLLFSPFVSHQIHGLELKRPGEDMRLEQLAWCAWVEAHGGKYAVASTMHEALMALDDWGCLRIKYEPRTAAE